MSRPWRKQGFTLIELLVVIAIIAVLTALVVPAVKTALDRGKEAAARSAVLGIETAWKSYFQEYGKWPIDNYRVLGQPVAEFRAGPRISTEGLEVNDEIMALLTGDPDDWKDYEKEIHNRKGIPFLEVNEESLRKGSGDRYGTYVDPWGSPYLFLFDVDYDNRVKHPKWVTSDNDPGITKRVIVWSQGKDGESKDDETRRDDIVSW